jgi:hypothetical protein
MTDVAEFKDFEYRRLTADAASYFFRHESGFDELIKFRLDVEKLLEKLRILSEQDSPA